MKVKRLKYPALSMSLFAVVAILLLEYAGLFKMADGAVYDRLVRGNISPDHGVSQVLLVRVPLQKHDEGDGYWSALLRDLKSQQAGSISFGFTPERVSPDFFKLAAGYGNVIFGRHLRSDIDLPERLILQPLPDAAAGVPLQWGVVAPLPVDYGVSRYQQSRLSVADGFAPSLEVAIAKAAGVEAAIENPYLVNFMAGAGRIPMVNADRVLSGGIIPELVQGKHVLIDFDDEVRLSRVLTPVGGGSQSISLLEFHGYALNTLLQQQVPVVAGHLATTLLVILIAGFSVFIYQWLTLRAATWVSLAMVLSYLIIAWLALSFTLIWLPVVEMVVAQALMFLLLYRYKSVRDELDLRQMALSSSAELHEKLVPSNFLASHEHWSQVINLVNQTLDLNRVIFLERIIGDHRLREIKSLNCSIDSIVEQRRDYERTPYSTAIATHGAVKLERPYLEKSEYPEDQYLVPLIFAGDVLGFWAFGITPEKAASIPLFMQKLNDYGQKIAELLYQRQQWQVSQTEVGGVTKYLQIKSGSAVYKTLLQSSELISRRMKSLENVFDGLGTATALYDLFGGLMQVNQRMLALVKSDNLPIYEMTALDLMMAITDMDSSRARYSLRYVVMEHGTLTVPVRMKGLQEKTLVLNVRPMIQSSESLGGMGGVAPFQLFGILFELVDVTYFKKIFQLKEQLVNRLNIQLRNDMESLVMASGLLNKKDLPEEKRSRVTEIINQKVMMAVQMMGEAQQHLDMDISGGPLECYPIDAYPIATEMVDSLKDKANERRLSIKADISRLVGLVFAEPDALSDLLKTLLTIVMEDAVEASEVEFTITQVDHQVLFDFSNTGFGIPDDRFQEYIFGDGDVDTETFRRLRGSMAAVHKWNGSLTAESGVGEGMHFVLSLRGFL